MEEKYYILIHKNLTGEISSEENSQLEKWLSESPENLSIYKEIDSTWKDSLVYNSNNVFDKSAAYNKHLKLLGIENKPKRQIIMLMRSLAAIFLLVLGAVLVFNTFSNSHNLSSKNYTQSFILPDGSKVFLSPHSSLVYDNKFNEEVRKIKLKGKAYFHVVSDAQKPFKVENDKFTTTVLGTEFIVDRESVAVKSGKVAVADGKESILLIKNEKVNISDISKVVNIENTEFDWLNESLVFNNDELPKVLQDIGNHFNVTFKFKSNKDYSFCKFTSKSLSNLKLKDVIGIMETTFECKISKIEDNTFLVSNVKCK